MTERLPSGRTLEVTKSENGVGAAYVEQTEKKRTPHQMLREALERAPEASSGIETRIEPEALLNFSLLKLVDVWQEDSRGKRVDESYGSWRRVFVLRPKSERHYELRLWHYKDSSELYAEWRREDGVEFDDDPQVGAINKLFLSENGNLVIEGWSFLTLGEQEWIHDRTQRMEITPRGEVFWQTFGKMCWRKPQLLGELRERVEKLRVK